MLNNCWVYNPKNRPYSPDSAQRGAAQALAGKPPGNQHQPSQERQGSKPLGNAGR